MEGRSLYMAVGGYEPSGREGCADIRSLHIALEEGLRAAAGRAGVESSRVYLALSGPAYYIVWTVSWRPEALARLRVELASLRCFAETVWWPSVYWASPYAKGLKPEEVLELAKGKPMKYFIAYPMKKSPEWYLLPFDERRRIMGEHIGVARKASEELGLEVRSYTTYAFGIADYEFLVIYEAEDLALWARVVERLREAKARKWVVREEPVLTGVRTDLIEAG